MKTKMSSASFSSSKVTREWLHEYKVLSDAELHTFANTVRANDELIISLYQLFEDEDEPQEVLDPVCHQLFDFYRSDLKELKRFTLEFVPTLTMAYLTGVANNDKKRCGGIEACLLGIYNLEVTDKDGSPRIERFTIPTIACPSIYHEPPSLATLALTESALITFHGDEHVIINHGPLPQVENITAQNRLTILSHVMSCYNRDIANLSPRSHQKLCKMCSRLMTAGFKQQPIQEVSETLELNDVTSSTSSLSSSSRSNEFPHVDSSMSGSTFSRSDSKKSNSLRDSLKRDSIRKNMVHIQEQRITLDSTFLVELLNSVYFVMFNGHARLGIQAVEDIHHRACYQLWSDVLLVTNAIKNSLLYNPSGQPMEGPMGISIALSPTTSNPSFSKHAITNASFRAKKLPDDIPILDIDAESDMAATKVSRVDNDVLAVKPDEKNKHKKEKKDEKKEKDKKGKKRERHMTGERGTTEEKVTLLAPHDTVEYTAGQDDIDVPESPEGEGLPPTYDELVEQDRGKMDSGGGGGGGGEKNKSGHMFSKPLKSIMKSGKDKMKMTRKDSDAKRKEGAAASRDVTDTSHSPRHSTINPLPTSQSLNISQSVSNGAIDLENITVAVVRSMSKTKVDQMELRNVGMEAELGQHRRTSSFPEGGFTTAQMMGEMPSPTNGDVNKPLLRPGSDSHDFNHANESDDETNNTKL